MPVGRAAVPPRLRKCPPAPQAAWAARLAGAAARRAVAPCASSSAPPAAAIRPAPERAPSGPYGLGRRRPHPAFSGGNRPARPPKPNSEAPPSTSGLPMSRRRPLDTGCARAGASPHRGLPDACLRRAPLRYVAPCEPDARRRAPSRAAVRAELRPSGRAPTPTTPRTSAPSHADASTYRRRASPRRRQRLPAVSRRPDPADASRLPATSALCRHAHAPVPPPQAAGSGAGSGRSDTCRPRGPGW
jgi:hypothetical protein